MGYRLQKLSEFIRGWMACFALSELYHPVPALDEWVGRRMRMCHWKQWRRSGQRVCELLKLGGSPNGAIPTALSRKSYWHIAHTLATQRGMPNQWLESRGVVSVRTLWIAFHYSAASPSG